MLLIQGKGSSDQPNCYGFIYPEMTILHANVCSYSKKMQMMPYIIRFTSQSQLHIKHNQPVVTALFSIIHELVHSKE